MSPYKYSAKVEGDKYARAAAVAMPISTKHAVEICSSLRGKGLEDAKRLLHDVLAKKRAIAFRKYNSGGVGHRPGMGTGRYPEKASVQILELLESVGANAKAKGLAAANLIITTICAKKGPKAWHYGRHGRRRMKRTAVEVIVQEMAKKEEKKAASPKAKAKGKKQAKEAGEAGK